MSIFKSWSTLFVLALFVCFFAGCGGGGSGSNDVANLPDNPSWDTYDPRFETPTPNNPVPEPTPQSEQTTPTPTPEEPSTPEPETTPTPTPDTPASEPITTEPDPTPTTPDTTPTPTTDPEPAPETTPTTDTYDIASILNGDWHSVSGSGTATGRLGTINAILQRMSASIVRTQITGNTGTALVTFRQYWDYVYNNYGGTFLLYSDVAPVNISRIDTDTWRLDGEHETVVIILFTSETTAIIMQEGNAVVNGGDTYHYSARYTVEKSS